MLTSGNMLYVVFVFEMKLNHLFFVFRPFFEGMSHSSSQTEIGSIHSQKSQQRELSCPVSLLPGTLFKKKKNSQMLLSAIVHPQRSASRWLSYVKELPLESVQMSGRPRCLRCFRDPRGP